MRIRLLYVLAGISFLMIFLAACTGRKAEEEFIPMRSRNLASATEFINERCPEQVDSETRMDSVILTSEGELHFYYTLPNKDKIEFSPQAFTAFMLAEIARNVRTNRDLKMHRDSSVMMKFNYRDRNGEVVADFALGPEGYR